MLNALGRDLQSTGMNRVDFPDLLVSDLKTLAGAVDVLIVTQNTQAHRDIIRERRKGQVVIDLVHLDGHASLDDYHVLC